MWAWCCSLNTSFTSTACGRLPGELSPVVRSGPVQHGPGRHDPLGVEVRVGRVVVPLDVIEVRGRAEGRVLVEVAGVGPEIRVVHDPAHARLEMGDVDGVEP